MSGCAPKWKLTSLEPASPPVVGDSGMVVAAHPMAAEAGLSVLRDGGNAFDAALASLFMLNVVEPHASGLGGGGFALVRTADGNARVIVYRDRAPKNVDSSFYYAAGDSDRIRLNYGGSAVCVPGAAAGWAELYDSYATLPLERLMRDAIKAAEDGFPIDQVLADQLAGHYEAFSKNKQIASIYLKAVRTDSAAPGDSSVIYMPLAVGDTLRQPDLARTFKTLAAKGLRSFYRGPIAEAVVNAVQADSGSMTLEDLEYYRAEKVDPIRGKYGDCELLTVPPPSSGGLTLIEALSLIDRTHSAAYPIGSGDALNMLGQCIQQSYVDAMSSVGDPTYIHSDWGYILSDEHLSRAAAIVKPDRKPGAHTPIRNGELSDHGNTTHLVVADRWGNCISLTQSINHFFGSGLIAGKTGVWLNNQAGDFSPNPADTLNRIAPNRRPRSNMAPVIVLKDGKPYIVLGTPGAQRIPATVAEIIVNVMNYKLDISNAIAYPRFFNAREHIVMENRFPRETFDRLHHLGYLLHPLGPWELYFGGAHGIVVQDGKLYGAADPRRGGAAKGW